jgi:SAM-dependent methyltransferase
MMIDDNKIIPPSRTTPGKSFNSLMGLENHISKLIAFINSISDWAYGNFMLQCFKEPNVIFGNDPNDPQFKLFKKFLEKKSKTNLLDFGAGKGRIGYTIKEDEEISNQIVYSAFEPDKGNYELLNNVPDIKKTYSNIEEIPDNTFDCVLLCNVLHEINPNDWIESFNAIKRTLKDDGFLLIIEDKFLPRGENAHQFGYLILGSEETKILLKSNDVLELKLQEEKFKERILFNAFTKEQINPSDKTILEALTKLKENSFINLKKIKKEEKNIDQGRRYANQTQLYINAQLAIEGIKN